jgi:exosortase
MQPTGTKCALLSSQGSVMKNQLDQRKTMAVVLVVLAACLFWALWPALAAMADRWARDPRYAHGYFVPLFAVALLWLRWGRMEKWQPSPSTWGLALVGLGAALQLAGGFYRIRSLVGLALLPYLGGVGLLVGGWQVLRWAWPAIGFLVFMVPLPFRVENALGPPLQTIATTASTYLLQTLGFMAFAEGFVIQLNEAKIGVVDACSGLSMLITFIALSTAAALVVRRPLSDRLVLVASAIPVALLANIFRIVLTGTLHELVGGDVATTFYHDLAGWIMMPLALVLYWFELWIFAHLLIETRHEAVPVLELVGSSRPPGGGPAATRRYQSTTS